MGEVEWQCAKIMYDRGVCLNPTVLWPKNIKVTVEMSKRAKGTS